MKNIVIGLGFGDEGKGMVTDFLCSHLPSSKIVTRFSGGHQAGHTVELKGYRHVFSNFGSGTLRGIPTYWSERCTVDPIGLVNELTILLNQGFKPRLYINQNCPITTPYDKSVQQIKNREGVNQFNTCGVGFGSD